MYKSSEQILIKLRSGEVKLESVSRNMNKYFHKKDIDKWVLFAKARCLYRMELLDK